MRRALVALMALTLLAGCDLHRDPWHSSAPWAPSLPQTFGVRVTDGHLVIWTGTPCRGVKALQLQFHREPPILFLDSIDPDGVEIVEHIRFGGPYPGFVLRRPFPVDFDWREEETLSLLVTTSDGPFASSTPLREALEHSDEHPEDTYYFDRAGWLDAAGVAANDGDTILTACTPDPAKQ